MPEVYERCGETRHGFYCDLPRGHNIGRVDLPDNHSHPSLMVDAEDLYRAARKVIEQWKTGSLNDLAHAMDELKTVARIYD